MLNQLLRNDVHLRAFIEKKSEPVVIGADSGGFELSCGDGMDEVDVNARNGTRNVRSPMSRWCIVRVIG